jgi:hypothetical protein
MVDLAPGSFTFPMAEVACLGRRILLPLLYGELCHIRGDPKSIADRAGAADADRGLMRRA